jgi:hypothetical protein
MGVLGRRARCTEPPTTPGSPLAPNQSTERPVRRSAPPLGGIALAAADRFEVRPISPKRAQQFLVHHDRHRDPMSPGAFAAALHRGGRLVGVAMASGFRSGQSSSLGSSLEITHLCVLAGVPNGCSRLLGALKRAGKALGYQKAITYTLPDEPGISPRAAGFHPVLATADTSRDGGERNSEGASAPVMRIRWEALL